MFELTSGFLAAFPQVDVARSSPRPIWPWDATKSNRGLIHCICIYIIAVIADSESILLLLLIRFADDRLALLHEQEISQVSTENGARMLVVSVPGRRRC